MAAFSGSQDDEMKLENTKSDSIVSVCKKRSKRDSTPSPPTVGRSSSRRYSLRRNHTDTRSSSKSDVVVIDAKKEISTIHWSQIDISDMEETKTPDNIQKYVETIEHTWKCNMSPKLPPDIFLLRLLKSRGYNSENITASKIRETPSNKQLQDYNNDVLISVRTNNSEILENILKNDGVNPNACNQFGESLLHTACRTSEYSIVNLLLNYGANPLSVDDYGRTSLHYACWRAKPRFDIIMRLLNDNPLMIDMLRIQDIRGACPLCYVPKEQWLSFCAFFFLQKKTYWKPSSNSPLILNPSSISLENEIITDENEITKDLRDNNEDESVFSCNYDSI